MTMVESSGGVMVPAERETRTQLPAAQQSTDLMSAVAQAALDPRVDVDKMRALFDMRNEEIARVAQQQFSEAMAEAQGEMTPVYKGAWNDQTKSHYARLEHIVEMIVPVYSRHGFSMSFGTVPGAPEGCIRTACDVRHEGGHVEHYELDMELDNAGIAGKVNKTGPHARGSSISYCRRYLTCMVWNIPTGRDDDGNAAGGAPAQPAPEPISEEHRANLQERIEAMGKDVAAFCRVCKVTSLADITTDRWPAVLKRLEQAEREHAAAE